MPDNRAPNALRRRTWAIIFGFALLILLSPVLLMASLLWFLAAISLHVVTLIVWSPRGRRVLFVYSDSPVWKEYVETNILPRLPKSAVILNWSQRSRWRSVDLAVWLFRFYGGWREYNPLALVIRPLRGPRVFRFWRAFRDFKHGKVETLQRLEATLLKEIGAA
jgi:hypothetical protein